MRTAMAVTLVLAGIAWGTPSFAQGAGRSLDIQPGARQNGMGAAGVALESDPADAMWWNPAALGFAEWPSANYTRARLLPGLADDLIHQHVAGATRVRPGLGVGMSGTFLSFGEPDIGFGAGADEWTEWSWAAAVGHEVLPGLAIGLAAKYVKIEWPALWLGEGAEASTFGFDIGGLYRGSLEGARVSAGFNLQNLGPEMEFEGFDQSEPLSRNLRVGVAATLPLTIEASGVEAGVTAAFDYSHSWVEPQWNVENFGAEAYGTFRGLVRLAARVGYYDDDLGEITDLTFGAGVRVAGASLDYAEIPQARNSGLERVRKWTVGFHVDPLFEALTRR